MDEEGPERDPSGSTHQLPSWGTQWNGDSQLPLTKDDNTQCSGSCELGAWSLEQRAPRRYLDIILRAKLLLSMQYLLIEAGTNTNSHTHTFVWGFLSS